MKKYSKYHHSPLLGPVLAGMLSLLSFIAVNSKQLTQHFGSISTFLILTILFSLLIYALCVQLFQNKNKASIYSVIFLLAFFSYGHLKKIIPVYDLRLSTDLLITTPQYTTKAHHLSFILGKNKVLFPLIAIGLIVAGLKLKKRTRTLTPAIQNLNTILLIMTAVPLLTILSQYFNHTLTSSKRASPIPAFDPLADQNLPDIYYLIPDSYPRQDVLEQVLHYDNTPFLTFLADHGFYVSSNSRSNYAHTYLSLPSTFDMKHLTYLTQELGAASKNTSLPMSLMSDNQVSRILKSYGYTIINLASGWGPTDKNEFADINYYGATLLQIPGVTLPLNEFTITFLKTTALNPVIESHIINILRHMTVNAFEYLQNTPEVDGPKFVLAHFIVPHPPYVFKADGSPQDESELDFSGDLYQDTGKFLDQLQYVNQALMTSITAILEANPNTIIILQSDHGSPTLLGNPLQWQIGVPENNPGIYERHAILSAYYFPDQDYSLLEEPITPVNTFRILFNRYFQANLDLLPHTSYFSTYTRNYDFLDVTELLDNQLETILNPN